MTLKDLLEIINYIVGKQFPDMRPLTPQNFNRLLQMANIQHFKRKIGLPEEYSPGMPIPTQAYNVSQMNTEDLRPFKESYPITLEKTGSFSIPDKYYYHSSLMVGFKAGSGTNYTKAIVVTDDQWDDMVGSKVNYPTEYCPICNYQANFIRVYPKDALRVIFSYLRKPSTPYYAMKQLNGVMVYDDDNSEQLEWNESNQYDILALILSNMGIALGKESVIQMAEMKKQRGI
jgi:hypothetical protein